jgi:putative ABC transport system ATP-binding protein
MPEMSDPGPALEFENVGLRRGDIDVLDSVTGIVPGHEVTAIAGPSGVGKTSLLRLCNRLDVPDRGRILYRGRDVAEIDPLELRRRIGMVFQTPRLLPETVRDNLVLASLGAGQAALEDALARVGLAPDLLDRPYDRLSGGEAQRVCLARTLITEPDVLLADEPTSALDPTPRLAFERLTRSLVEDGLTIVWVTHDLEQMRRLADHVLVLIGGRARYEGPPEGLDDRSDLADFMKGEPDAGS